MGDIRTYDIQQSLPAGIVHRRYMTVYAPDIMHGRHMSVSAYRHKVYGRHMTVSAYRYSAQKTYRHMTHISLYLQV